MNVLIIGTSTGLGKALLEVFTSEGHTVVSVSRSPNPNKLHHLNYQIGIEQDRKSIIDFFEKNIHLLPDTIIYCAGLLIKKPFKDQTVDDIMNQFNINLLAPLFFTRLFMTHFQTKVKTQHLYIGSMAGYQDSKKVPGLSIYSISKAGLHALSQTLATEFHQTGHFFNSIALGAVKTDMLNQAFDSQVNGSNLADVAMNIYAFTCFDKRMINGEIVRFDEYRI